MNQQERNQRERELRAHDERVKHLIHNPHVIYRSPLPVEEMRQHYEALGYPPHTVQLFMDGLPVLGAENGNMTVEYPDGRRYALESSKNYDEEGRYSHNHLEVTEELEKAPR